ncbi:hypothetical protein Q3G72_032637 [Acer saccharum]|nr:hypothetical protein Q3G72_032631 [Acer saccharum]KAK1569112.1 hypothetical protein Q3G72_032637 [Acer saccharum]
MNSVADLASLEKLRLDKILNLKCMPSEFFHGFTALCDLQLASWFLWPEKEEALPHLLECLEISYCYNLVQIPPGILSLKSFKTLNINNCPKLSSLPEMNSPSNLRHLEIKECQALPFLPNGLMRNENLPLELLVIDSCSSLESFPDGDLPVTLHHLQISNCSKLNVLPTSNSSASSSDSSSSLKVLEVCDCIMLSSLPDHLYNFIHLDKLLISNCLRLVSFPDGGLPPNLMSLSISDCHNLRELPDRLYNITSLQELTIRNCNSLRSYPEGGLPTNLRILNVIGCNLLEPPSRWDLYKLSSLGDYLITNDRHRLSSRPSHI